MKHNVYKSTLVVLARCLGIYNFQSKKIVYELSKSLAQ